MFEYIELHRKKFFFGIIVVLLISLTGCSTKYISHNDKSAGKDAGQLARQYSDEALRSYERGDFENAISKWSEALSLLEKRGDPKETCTALVRLARAYLSIGDTGKAIKSLTKASAIAKKSGDQADLALVLSTMGNVYLTDREQDLSRQRLQEALAIARRIRDPHLCAAILNDMGNLFSLQEDYQEAIAAYGESIRLANKASDNLMAATALSNTAAAETKEREYVMAKSHLDEASRLAQSTEDSHHKAFLLINIGIAYNDLRQYMPGLNSSLFALALQSLNQALVVSQALDDLRANSYALGYVGALYEDEHRYDEGLRFTRHASLEAQKVDMPEAQYKWQWQTARLLEDLHQTDAAISSYREALVSLESIRPEMSNCYGKVPIPFREQAKPLFLEFVDLLLQRAASTHHSSKAEDDLYEARNTIELLKVYELRDYFHDQCLDAERSGIKNLDVVSKTAAVIYPILLPNRVELLVNFPTTMKRYSVPVDSETMTREIRDFRSKLEKLTTPEYLPHAQQLYKWLIRPLEKDLQASGVDTLVFVPDGPLRTIPMSALNDGNQFLISKYAVVVTPGLTLTDPHPINRKNMQVLALGLTKSTQGFPSLPYVSDEIKAVEDCYHGEVLLNEKFELQSMKKSLHDEPFAVIHIASHGEFKREYKDTFILTFKNRLTMDRLSDYIGLFRFRNTPLELLTLSACETAAGDDRAALGLAGVAVKSGARSALATLWFINDRASSLLIGEFYRQLRNPAVSRAHALQRAQLKLLNDRRYRHPRYWSPYLLINNWL